MDHLSGNQLKKIRKLQQKKFRTEFSLLLCEGVRTFKSAVLAGSNISEIVVTDEFMNNSFFDFVKMTASDRDIALMHCNTAEMRSISDELTPSGLLFLVSYTHKGPEDLGEISAPSVIFLENISDPGNLGTIMRSSVWFGIATILLSPGCVEAGNPKTVRASAGAIFSTNIYTDILPDQVFSHFRSLEYCFTAAALKSAIPLSDWQPGAKNITFLGSEANGLSTAVIEQCDQVITIPGSTDTESLNLSVATGIILYQLAIKNQSGVKINAG